MSQTEKSQLRTCRVTYHVMGFWQDLLREFGQKSPGEASTDVRFLVRAREIGGGGCRSWVTTAILCPSPKKHQGDTKGRNTEDHMPSQGGLWKMVEFRPRLVCTQAESVILVLRCLARRDGCPQSAHPTVTLTDRPLWSL